MGKCVYLYFTGKDIKQRWEEVKGKEDMYGEWNFWEDIKPQAQFLAKRLMEHGLEVEMKRYVNAEWYEHKKNRRDQRNGYYARDLLTGLGLIREIRVPRTRKKGFRSRIVNRYKRRQKEVDRLVLDMFLNGISTRRVGETLEPLLGTGLSAGTVSRITKLLDGAVRRFHRHTLTDKYMYLLFDGIVVKTRLVKVEKKVVLCAYGITGEGRRELIDFMQAKNESESNWYIFLNDLYRRGLEGKNTELLTTDGGPGLQRALDTVYPRIPRQRCWVHKERNVANKVPRRKQKECLSGVKKIYNAENRQEAIRFFKEWEAKWKEIVPKAVECLRKDLPELLTFFDYPQEHWKKIRTTNALERSFREVRRRIRLINIFTNERSCDRIIFGVISGLNKRWREHPLKEFRNYSWETTPTDSLTHEFTQLY